MARRYRSTLKPGDLTRDIVVMDGLRFRPKDRTEWVKGWPLHNARLKELMGLPPKLPKTSTEPMFIGNVKVWLVSVEDIAEAKPKNNRPHRIMAVCPSCQDTVPAGRLFQHKCK